MCIVYFKLLSLVVKSWVKALHSQEDPICGGVLVGKERSVCRVKQCSAAWDPAAKALFCTQSCILKDTCGPFPFNQNLPYLLVFRLCPSWIDVVDSMFENRRLLLLGLLCIATFWCVPWLFVKSRNGVFLGNCTFFRRVAKLTWQLTLLIRESSAAKATAYF